MNYNKKMYPIWILLALSLLYFIFYIIPILMGVFYSFTHWNIFSATYCGLYNYKSILTNTMLRLSIKNTFVFAILASFFKVFLGLILAIFLNRKIVAKNFLRTIYFSPAVINNVAVAMIFTAILNPSRGILNVFLRYLGLDFLAQNWLTDSQIALFSVIGIEVWKWSGFCMVIFIAGLQSISSEYYEAAYIDGANSWKKFRYITFPLIMPSFNNVVIINIISGLKVFDIIYVTTRGGPGRVTNVVNIMVFEAFGSGRYGEATAGNVLLSIMVGIVVAISYRILRKNEVEV
ncbi:MAG: hypothetical protein A2Y21_04425 [Clostridiales bacterium GWC2_40_7]|nr:MAG: hypothetical protein A2Y21_04425 [Clostridiales bacterium GWC2_40_7]